MHSNTRDYFHIVYSYCVMCTDAEMVKAAFSVYSSLGETVHRYDILCNTHLYAILWLSIHAARVYSMHQNIQVLCCGLA